MQAKLQRWVPEGNVPESGLGENRPHVLQILTIREW